LQGAKVAVDREREVMMSVEEGEEKKEDPEDQGKAIT
jgi:hypothetical protein